VNSLQVPNEVEPFPLSDRELDAARALAATDAALPPQQSNERALLNVELAIDRGQREQALRELHAIPEPREAAAAARFRPLQAVPPLAGDAKPQVRPVASASTPAPAPLAAVASRG